MARHLFASPLIREGAPITMVRGLLGHAELTTTNIYAHTVTDARAVIGRLDAAPPRKQKGVVEGEIGEI